MNIALIVLSSITAIVLFLYFFSYYKKQILLKNVLSASLFVVLGSFFSLILYNYFPDSKHIFFSTIISYLMITIGYVLSFFEKNFFIHLSRFFLLMITFVWSELYFSTFYLYHIPKWVHITSASCAFITLVMSVILLRSKKFISNFWVIAGTCGVLFLNYCTFATLCTAKQPYSILMFAGSFLFEVTLIYNILEATGRAIKHTEPSKLILLLLSQVLISSAGVLMVHM